MTAGKPFDPVTRRWSQTYNVPIDDAKPHAVRLFRYP